MDIEEYRGYTIASEPCAPAGDHIAFTFLVTHGGERELLCRCEVSGTVLRELGHDRSAAHARCRDAIHQLLDRDEYIKGEGFTLAITEYGEHRG